MYQLFSLIINTGFTWTQVSGSNFENCTTPLMQPLINTSQCSNTNQCTLYSNTNHAMHSLLVMLTNALSTIVILTNALSTIVILTNALSTSNTVLSTSSANQCTLYSNTSHTMHSLLVMLTIALSTTNAFSIL